MLGKYQWFTIGVALIAGIVLYFGLSMKKPKMENVESTRLLNQMEISETIILRRAQKKLSAQQGDIIHLLQKSIEKNSGNDTLKIQYLKRLSGKWYEYGYPIVSAIYAQEVAGIENKPEAWAIAGSTAFIALGEADNDLDRKYARAAAIKSYESAVSLAPDELSFKVNLAMTYVEAPPQGNPMKGVLMLLEMDEKYPDEPLILKTLAELGIRTGQYQKAANRLVKVTQLNPDDRRAWCLLVEAYKHISVDPVLLNEAVEHCRN